MVDREHKALLELVGLILMVDEKESIAERERVLRVELAALHRYVDQHFSNEEQLLEAVGSPYLTKQRIQHNVLRSEFDILWTPSQEAPSHKIINKIALWSKDHLLKHFLTSDMKVFQAPPFAE